MGRGANASSCRCSVSTRPTRRSAAPPVSDTTTARGFSDADQERLQALTVDLAGRDVRVLLTNSSAPSIGRLYGGRAAVSAGFQMRRVPARRAINTRADRRGYVDELVVSNLHRVARGLCAWNGPCRSAALGPKNWWHRRKQATQHHRAAAPDSPGKRATLARESGPARVAELADAPDLGSGSRKAMGVRLPPFAPVNAHAGHTASVSSAKQPQRRRFPRPSEPSHHIPDTRDED